MRQNTVVNWKISCQSINGGWNYKYSHMTLHLNIYQALGWQRIFFYIFILYFVKVYKQCDSDSTVKL